MFVKCCLWILLISPVWGYDPSPAEKKALNAVFGPQIAEKIALAVEIGNDRYSRIEYFSSYDNEIHVDSRKIGYFRDNLMIVHEGMHWYQYNILHRGLAWFDDPKAYSFTSFDLYMPMGQEQEAEAARLYAAWYVHAWLYEPVMTDLTDSKESRDDLAFYLSTFDGLNLAR